MREKRDRWEREREVRQRWERRCPGYDTPEKLKTKCMHIFQSKARFRSFPFFCLFFPVHLSWWHINSLSLFSWNHWFTILWPGTLFSFFTWCAVVHPVASISIRTQKNASTAIILTWITILLTCSPALIAHGEQIYDYKGTHYSQCQFKEEYNKELYYSIFFLSSYIVPITIVFVLYLLMLNRLWFGAVPGGRMSSESVRSKVITIFSLIHSSFLSIFSSWLSLSLFRSLLHSVFFLFCPHSKSNHKPFFSSFRSLIHSISSESLLQFLLKLRFL